MSSSRSCAVDDCGRKHFGRGWCEKHYRQWWSKQTGVKRTPAAGADHHNWSGDQIGYRGAHLRVRRVRGDAADHACAECGGPAAHWAYDNADSNERRHADGRRYSADPAHCVPMCVPCHSRHDAKVRAA